MEKVIRFIKTKSLIKKGDFIVIGLSGGADSVYLLRVLCALRQDMDLTLRAVHVNHQLREEAVRDQHFAENLCRDFEVPLRIVSADVKAAAQKNRMSLEEAGREIRYAAFHEELKGKEAGKIAVAHHQNDQAETFLFRAARGTGLNGAGAMRAADLPVIRPLLCMTKREIQEELERIGQAWVEDASNEDTAYARNQIRKHAIPSLEAVNEKAVEHIASLAQDLQEAEAFLREKIREAYQNVEEDQSGRKIIDIKQLKSQHPWLQKQIVKKALEEMAGRKKDIEKRHILSVLELADRETGKRLSLPYQVIAEKNYHQLCLRKEEAQKHGENEPKGCLLQEEINDFLNISEKDCIKIIDYDRIEKGIQLRCREPGDFFTFGPLEKRKSLSRYFIDEKVPRELRDQMPLAADGSHIVWIIGKRVSSHYEVSESTRRYLKLEFKREGDEAHAKDQRTDF